MIEINFNNVTKSYGFDIVLNKPKEKEVFQKTLKNYKCSNCKFRILCNDDSV